MGGASSMRDPWVRIHRCNPSTPTLRRTGTKFSRFRYAACHLLHTCKFFGGRTQPFFICFAAGLLLSGAQPANALNHDHPPGTVLQLPQTIAQASEAGVADPCMNTGQRVAHCCSALHCMAGFAASPATLPSPS